ncbi:MAG TPA: polyribonucleotide nucleotidyltransferase, partial [Gemmatimonadota bacterium]|nr:polyribonucleotide nucleotidyltransferase [Gemmatimonadota bacterium]
MITRKTIQVGGEEMVIETGKLARLANGSVTVKYGETIVLCTATASPKADYTKGWFPLFVEYREKMYSAGKIPGGFFKREGRPGEKEVLSARLIDRPCRPMFPDGFMHETQLVCDVLSYDATYDPDVLGIVGCSAAVSISGIPFETPVAGVRVARVDGSYVINPSFEQLDESDLDVVVAGTADSVVMVEGSGDEVSEEALLGAMDAAQEAIATICAAIAELKAEVGKEPMKWSGPEKDEALESRVRELSEPDVRTAMAIGDKEERNRALDEMRDRVTAALETELGDGFAAKSALVKNTLKSVEKSVMRNRILDAGVRADGR